jgi:septal ring factor EnvC (AmiA/AmiB activator)
MRLLRGVSCLAVLLAVWPAFADSSSITQAQHALQAARLQAARHRKAAEAAAMAAQQAAAKRAALVQQEVDEAAKLRAYEQQTARNAAQLAQLQAEQRDAAAERKADAAAIAPLLPLITRLATHPAATLLAAQATPEMRLAPGDAVKGALIMRGLTRMIASRAAALRQSEDRLALLTRQVGEAQAAVTESIGRQQRREQALDSDVNAVQSLESQARQQAAAEQEAAAAAGNKARTLRQVIGRLREEARRREMLAKARAQKEAAAKARAEKAAERVAVPEAMSKALRHGPVAGHLVRSFGAATVAGPASGDTFAAAPGAVVVTPVAGRVVFARKFPGYGKLLILDCGHGYDFVLAGLDRFDVAVGNHIAAGQPVGRMPGYDPARPSRQPALYVELRHDGSPVDPTPVFVHGGRL